MTQERLRRAALWLAKRQQQRNGEAVTYTRSGTNYTQYLDSTGVTVPLTACLIRGRSERVAMQTGRAQYEVLPADWIILGEFFATASGTGLVEPKDGDRITDASGRKYELGPRDGEYCYRDSDQWGYAKRLRTIRVPQSEEA